MATTSTTHRPVLLVVDDEPDHGASLKDFLQAAFPDATVTAEPDPVKALEQFWAMDVDLVVSDYRMPRMDGLHFLRRAKEISPKTVTILMSAYTKPLMRSLKDEHPHVVDRVFLKPLETQPFIRFVRSVIERAEERK